jgi:DMSO/TMAO reductase YedYZ molybdopterin-dependent catalytic subunit
MSLDKLPPLRLCGTWGEATQPFNLPRAMNGGPARLLVGSYPAGNWALRVVRVGLGCVQLPSSSILKWLTCHDKAL